MEERLDRAVATDAWRSLHSKTLVLNLEVLNSDHSVVLLDIAGLKRIAHPRRFRFENSWLKEAGCLEVVTRTWNNSFHMGFLGQMPGLVEICYFPGMARSITSSARRFMFSVNHFLP